MKIIALQAIALFDANSVDPLILYSFRRMSLYDMN